MTSRINSFPNLNMDTWISIDYLESPEYEGMKLTVFIALENN